MGLFIEGYPFPFHVIEIAFSKLSYCRIHYIALTFFVLFLSFSYYFSFHGQ